jgi:hypothetical protein
VNSRQACRPGRFVIQDHLLADEDDSRDDQAQSRDELRELVSRFRVLDTL